MTAAAKTGFRFPTFFTRDERSNGETDVGVCWCIYNPWRKRPGRTVTAARLT